MNNSNRTYFRIPIGDWSGDGHCKCEYYTASSALTIKDVREAYFKSKDILPKIICPEEFLADYEDSVIDKSVVKAIKKAGYPIKVKNFYTKEMAEYVVWYINQGNFVCDIKLEPDVDDMLQFYGDDKKGRSIGFFGYGLLGD